MFFWWAIRVLSFMLGFCTAIYLVYARLGRKVSALTILLTVALGVVFSLVTELVMISAVWPPVTVTSWVMVAMLLTIVAFVFMSGTSRKELDQ